MRRNVRGDTPRLCGDDAERTSLPSSPSEEEKTPSSSSETSSEKKPPGSSRSAASASAAALVRGAPVSATSGVRASRRA